MGTYDKDFFDVFRDEMTEWIVPRRVREGSSRLASRRDEGYTPRVDNSLFGLALSGGGVRSATYCLGALQSLARLGMLRFVDILSTASGGGYLGAAWTSLTTDDEKYGTSAKKFPFKFIDDQHDDERQVFDRESPATRHIRAHGNWIAPHMGIFDVWSWVAVLRYLVSTVLNLLLIPLPWLLWIAVFTMLIRTGFWDRESPWNSDVWLYLWIGSAVLLTAFGLSMWWQGPKPNVGGSTLWRWIYRVQKVVLVTAVVWMFAGFFVLARAVFDDWLRDSYQLISGLSLAAMIGSVGVIGKFFSGEMQGGVQGQPGGLVRRALGLLTDLVGYVALVSILLVVYYQLDIRFLIEGTDQRPTISDAFPRNDDIPVWFYGLLFFCMEASWSLY